VVTKPTNAHKCIQVYYVINLIIPPTCFDHSCGHPQEGALQRMDMSRCYESLWTRTQMQNANFTFFEPCIVMYLCNKSQQNAHFTVMF